MRLSVAHTRLSMNKQTQDLSSVVIQLFPNFGSSQIQEKKRSNNGAPFLIQDGTKKYWLKLVNSSTMEDSLRDVEKQALQEVKSPNVIELIDVKTKVINGQRFDGLLFAFIEGEDLATIFAKKKSSKPKGPGGYQNLIVYQQAVVISDLTDEFCQRFLDSIKDRRTIEQMVQAARSGKQNIVEASLEKSLKMNIKLNGVSRASYGELLEDYKDFLRLRNLLLWDKSDPRVQEIRSWRIRTNGTNWTNLTNLTDLI